MLPQERITPEKVWRRGAENPPEYMVVQGGLTDAMVKTLIMSNTDLKGKKDGAVGWQQNTSFQRYV